MEASETTGVQAPPPKGKRGRRLYSLQNVRTLLADTLREVEDEDPTTWKPADRIARARTLIYGAQAMGELIKSTDIEARIAALEARKP